MQKPPELYPSNHYLKETIIQTAIKFNGYAIELYV